MIADVKNDELNDRTKVKMGKDKIGSDSLTRERLT